MLAGVDERIAQLKRNGLTGTWLGQRLGISSQRIDVMRRGGELVGIRLPPTQEYVYPSWQFDADLRPRASVPRLLQAAREAGVDELRLHELMTARMGLTGGRTLADALREGRDEQVLTAIRSAR